MLAAPLLPAATASADPPREVRFATFNVSMFRATEGELANDLADAGDEAQDVEVRNVAEIIQRQRPDVLLLNEFDDDAEGAALERFQDSFLSIGQRGADPIDYPYAVAFSSNTGVPSGDDLNNNGSVGTSGRAYGDDSFGFGEFPGQYAFALLSMYPIDHDDLRTFQLFRWADMPGARLPDDPGKAAVLRRGAGGLPAVEQEPRRRPGGCRRPQGARPGQSPDSARFRRT